MNDLVNENPKGRAKGGVARREKLSPERRSEIARQGALAKHSAKPLEAIKKGNFLADFGFDAECYVLNDERKTAVISQRAIMSALGAATTSGMALKMFAKSRAIAGGSMGTDIMTRVDNPLIFKGLSMGVNMPPPGPVHGYDVTLLIDVCNALIEAKRDGRLAARQVRFADQAAVIVAASAKSGIQGLVYKLAGYDATREEVIAAFKAFVLEEAKKYEKEFPSELYLEWARLYGHKPQRSWKDMHLTINHVYYPLAKSDGKLLALLKDSKSVSGAKNAKLFQFLNEVGARALRFHLGRVYDVAQSSGNQQVYEAEMAKRFGGQQLLNFSTE